MENHPFSTNKHGHLVIGGMDTTSLAEKYGTPLFVYDVSMIRDNCRSFVDAFEQSGVKGKVAYASKAFSSIAMLQVVKQEKLYLDVVSEGELYTALEAGFPTSKIHLHGNNKSRAELAMAIEHDIGCIVVDNFYEIDVLSRLLEARGKQVDVIMRVTPGIKSKTHQYIMTGNVDSKFGFDIRNGQADKAFRILHEHKLIRFRGLHCHIGSQIFNTDRFVTAADKLFQKLAEWNKTYGYVPEVLNLGGGFGIRYTEEDTPIPLSDYVDALINEVRIQKEKLSIPMPEIWLEPGRSIAGDAALTLYTVGSMKQIPGVRNYISVDGGMTDNIRPALYQAKYDAVIANKADNPLSHTVSVAGKCCESGDMLIWDLQVPEVESGDLLAVFSTGAYGYSMANHYNRFAKPAVVFVENGQDKLVVQRETFHDIVKNDLSYE